MSREGSDLLNATEWLPASIKRAMRLALRSGWYTIEAGRWASESGVCPIVAAAKFSGVWRDGHCADGGPAWGDEETPSGPVMAFAVSFDLYAELLGHRRGVSVLREMLETSNEAAQPVAA